jgi:hypothetical protein
MLRMKTLKIYMLKDGLNYNMAIYQINIFICEDCGKIESTTTKAILYDDPTIDIPRERGWGYTSDNKLRCPECMEKELIKTMNCPYCGKPLEYGGANMWYCYPCNYSRPGIIPVKIVEFIYENK